MNHKVFSLFFSFSLLILSGLETFGQVSTNAWSNFVSVLTYDGVTSPKAYTLQVEYPNVNIPNWTLMVKVDAITHSDGKVLEPSKIGININDVTGAGPTIQQLSPKPVPVLSMVNQALVDKSGWPLSSTTYKQFLITFDITIAKGSYLQALRSGKNYTLKLSFLILNSLGNPVSTSATTVGIQINPSGNPPVEPVYSIQVNNNASNGLLEFKSISDYVNGVSQTYSNGLSVVSETPYALQVKAQSSAFESLDSSIPLNTVSLNLKAANNSSVAGTVQLSNATQTIINSVINNGTQARAFDIRYYTSANDTRLQNAKPDTYKTTLIYTMIPQ